MALKFLQSLVQCGAPLGARLAVQVGKGFVRASDGPTASLSCLRQPHGRYPQDTGPETERGSMRPDDSGALGAGRSLGHAVASAVTSTMRVIHEWPASAVAGKAPQGRRGYGRFPGNTPSAKTQPAQPALRCGPWQRTAAQAR
jgi:hypothetical protein